MNWFTYVTAFFARIFLTNFVPHFVHGISGDRFPTPFSNPPGKGLSSPTLNVVWSLFNLLLGYLLFRLRGVASGGDPALLTFFAGVAVISIGSSLQFVHKNK